MSLSEITGESPCKMLVQRRALPTPQEVPTKGTNSPEKARTCDQSVSPTWSGALASALTRGQWGRSLSPARMWLPLLPWLQPVVMRSLPPSPAGIPLPPPTPVLTSHLAKRSEKPLTLPDPEFIDWSGPTGHKLTMWAEGLQSEGEALPGLLPTSTPTPPPRTHRQPPPHPYIYTPGPTQPTPRAPHSLCTPT